MHICIYVYICMAYYITRPDPAGMRCHVSERSQSHLY